MKIFTCKLRDLLGTKRHPVSIAPRDVLFDAQRHFLEKNFSYRGVKGHEVTVNVPSDGGPIVFKCLVSTRENVFVVVDHIVNGDWGDFMVKKVHFHSGDPEGLNYDWLRVSFFVDLRRDA